jgi:hypothetical protein
MRVRKIAQHRVALPSREVLTLARNLNDVALSRSTRFLIDRIFLRRRDYPARQQRDTRGPNHLNQALNRCVPLTSFHPPSVGTIFS